VGCIGKNFHSREQRSVWKLPESMQHKKRKKKKLSFLFIFLFLLNLVIKILLLFTLLLFFQPAWYSF